MIVGANICVDVSDSIEEGDDDNSRMLTELSADDIDAVFGDSNVDKRNGSGLDKEPGVITRLTD